MLLYNIEAMAQKMDIECNSIASHIEHMGLRGSHRENILKKYIGQLLPQKFSVGTGIIVDVKGTQSKQQDFFIYDAFNSPVFLNMESSSVVPVESVYATVEIKSKLTKETLRQSVDNIKSVKELELTMLKNSVFIPAQHNFILGSVFAYSSDIDIDTIGKNLDEFCKDMAPQVRPSMVCVFDQGIIINVGKNEITQIHTIPTEKTMWAISKNTKELNYYLFYLVLQQHLNTAKNFPPDLFRYAEASHALDGMQVRIPFDMIKDDMSINMGNSPLSGVELRSMAEATKVIGKFFSNQITERDLPEFEKSMETVTKLFIKSAQKPDGNSTGVAGETSSEILDKNG